MTEIPRMISLEEAQDLVLSHTTHMPAETVPLIEASGRVAAEDITSDMDVSPFAHAAMDGFAVRLADFPDSHRARRYCRGACRRHVRRPH